jgi:catechol 2,3-dioxygenase-like lactoylglutathione lyase family enzyme
MAGARLFRVILPVSDIDEGAKFYSHVLAIPGVRVSGGRHYFDCGGTILACFDPLADGNPEPIGPNPDYVYFAVDDLEGAYERARAARCRELTAIETQPWGERSFYGRDPFGNPICFVAEGTTFTGA